MIHNRNHEDAARIHPPRTLQISVLFGMGLSYTWEILEMFSMIVAAAAAVVVVVLRRGDNNDNNDLCNTTPRGQ
jgi:hypothetical protein